MRVSLHRLKSTLLSEAAVENKSKMGFGNKPGKFQTPVDGQRWRTLSKTTHTNFKDSSSSLRHKVNLFFRSHNVLFSSSWLSFSNFLFFFSFEESLGKKNQITKCVPEKRNKWGGGFRKLVQDYAWAILLLLLEGLVVVKRPWMCVTWAHKIKQTSW